MNQVLYDDDGLIKSRTFESRSEVLVIIYSHGSESDSPITDLNR
jgi:hypothetical protein